MSVSAARSPVSEGLAEDPASQGRGEAAVGYEPRAQAPRRLALVLFLAMVAVVLPAALVLGPSAGSDRSTLDRGPEGTAALAGVLGRLGVEVESLRVGLVPLVRQPPGSVLFMPSEPGLWPSSFLCEGAVELVERFLMAGSTVIAITHYSNAVLENWNIDYDWEALAKFDRGGPRWREGVPVLPSVATFGPPLAVTGRGGVESAHGHVLYSVGEVPVVIELPVGKGSLIVASDPSLVTNRGIGRDGNLEFWVRLVQSRLGEDGIVLFDDLHAGAMDDHGVVSYARGAGLLPAMLLALFGGVLYLWRAGTRFGAILPAREARNPRASAELVRAMSGLYQRAGLYAHALAVLSKNFRRRIERRSGLPWDRKYLDPWVQQELGPEAARTFGRIRRGFAALLPDPDPDKESALELARLVHSFEQEYLSKRVPRGRR